MLVDGHRCATAALVGLLVAAFGNRAHDAAAAQVGADGAGAVSLVRGLAPGWGIRVPVMTWMNIVQSLTLPPVSITDSGRP